MSDFTEVLVKKSMEQLDTLKSHKFEVVEVSKPISITAAKNLAKIVSKLSPMMGNLIEINIVEFLNDKADFQEFGKWKRQDPLFPDTIFHGDGIEDKIGFEVKAWFPFSTEITARFKDSQHHFEQNPNIYVALIAWIPENIIYGQPVILDIGIFDALSIAKARDEHYFRPPGYLVIEPQDTSGRTANLQQTNTAGYKLQIGRDGVEADSTELFGASPVYETSEEYQAKISIMMARHSYRLDTNFGKLDRVEHGGIEEFKRRVLDIEYKGRKIKDWRRIMSSRQMEQDSISDEVSRIFEEELDIKELEIDQVID